MRLRTVLGIVCLLVLAGCGGSGPFVDGPSDGSGDPGTTPTVSPAPLPETTAEFPPGVSRRGVVAPERLAQGHETTIANTSYTVRSNRTVVYANGSIRSLLVVEVALARNRTFLATAATAGPKAPVFLGVPPARATFWSNGSVYVRRFTAGGETTYNQYDPGQQFAGTWRYWTRTVPFGGRSGRPGSFYAGTFGAVTTRVTGRTTSGNASLVRLAGGGTRGSVQGTPLDGGGSLDAVRNVSLRATVGPRGVVRSLTVDYDATADGRPVHVHWTVHYLAIGETTVRRPPWFDRAVG
ncbi:MAG: hypothetical protein V5A62_05405 [Haloarculaceae archaeon]